LHPHFDAVCTDFADALAEMTDDATKVLEMATQVNQLKREADYTFGVMKNTMAILKVQRKFANLFEDRSLCFRGNDNTG